MQPFAWIDVPVSASDPTNNGNADGCTYGHGLKGPPTGEIGDPCRQSGNIFKLTLATGTFWMQELWSNTAGKCMRHA